jgi:GNAT superfamily N-acetyltransferase
MQFIKITEEVVRMRQMMNLDEQVKHIYQPTGNSCGPTCIKMVGDFIKGDVGKIDNICKTCGTDWVVGTPPDKMRIGLNDLKISYIEHVKEIEPYQSLKNTIDKGNVAIVRTITHGVPHWIVIVGYNENVFDVHDPWLGEIKYDETELEDIWKIRDFFYFEIIIGQQESASNVKIRKIEDEDIEPIFNSLSDIFDKTGLSNDNIWGLIGEYNPSISVVATIDDRIAGFYFLSKEQIIPGGADYKKLKNLNGVEGIALGVSKDFKNKGVGKKLIQYSQSIPGVDYIWGFQFKALKNIDDWLKRRKIYLDTPSMYITYQLLKKII